MIQTVKNHVKCLDYLIRHKYFVFIAGLKLGVPLYRLLVHDLSKFLPSEWTAYVHHFYTKDPSKSEWLTALNKHYNRNDHHFQYWVIVRDNGKIEPLDMPRIAILEMVADWFGAGRAIHGKWEADMWYRERRDTLPLHPKTKAMVDGLLGINPDGLRKRAEMLELFGVPTY